MNLYFLHEDQSASLTINVFKTPVLNTFIRLIDLYKTQFCTGLSDED